MAGIPNDHDASGISNDEVPVDDESLYSDDESPRQSRSKAGEDSSENEEIEEVLTKSISKDLQNCSISPEKHAARNNRASDFDESLSDEEMPEDVKKGAQSKEPGEKAEPGRPKFTEMILEAMVSAGPSRSGVSVQQIKKLVHLKYPDLVNKSDVYFRNGLKRLVDTEKLIQVTGTGATGSYKLAKPDKTKAAPLSNAAAANSKPASKPGPKSSKTSKSAENTKASSFKSPMKSSGKSTKAAVAKATVSMTKSATVRLTKVSNGSISKIATSNAPPKSDAVAGAAKPRVKPAISSKIAAVSKSSVPSKVSTKVRTDSVKSPKPKFVASKSPNPKSVAPKSPKPKSMASKSPKSKSVASKSPKSRSVVPKSPLPRTAASKSKLDTASDDTEKTARGPALKRGKK